MSNAASGKEPSRATVTRLTPAGRGAVATLSIAGDTALEMVRGCFRPHAGAPLAATPVGRIRCGSWLHDQGDPEEIVVCRRAEHVVEVHCHGGDAAAAAIIASLVSRGAVVADRETWLRRMYHDPLRQSLQLMLADARTQRTAGILLDQLHGAWPRALDRIATHLQTASRDATARQRAGEQLQRLLEMARLGDHLTTPWQVVVVGPPNVGKSSLVNTMLGFSRCIVFDQPGTTRDIVATHTALDGWPIELMDTAGLRAGRDAIEVEGVARAVASIASADLVVQVDDATRASATVEPEIAQHANVLTVANKCDLVRDPPRSADVQTSAVTKAGVDRLIEQIVCRLIPFPPTPGEAVPVTPLQLELLKTVHACIAGGEISRAAEMLSRPGAVPD